MKKKKVLVLLAAAAAVSAAVLAGCAKKGTKEPTESGESGTGTELESGTEETTQDGTQAPSADSAQDTQMPAGGDTQDTQAAAGGDTQSPQTPVVSEEARAELWSLLERVRDDVQPGSAGSSQKAAGVAVSLLVWAQKENMRPEDAKAIAREFIETQNAEWLGEAMEAVKYASQTLQGDDYMSLMESLGMNESDKTWGNDPMPLMEALIEAFGVS